MVFVFCSLFRRFVAAFVCLCIGCIAIKNKSKGLDCSISRITHRGRERARLCEALVRWQKRISLSTRCYSTLNGLCPSDVSMFSLPAIICCFFFLTLLCRRRLFSSLCFIFFVFVFVCCCHSLVLRRNTHTHSLDVIRLDCVRAVDR